MCALPAHIGSRHVRSSCQWSAEEEKAGCTEQASDNLLHVQAIALFGTDFSLIEKMFPSRQRKALKFKLRREYRDNPQNVDAALSGKDCGATSYQEVVTALQRVRDNPTITTIILAAALKVRRLQTRCAG